MAHPAPMSRFAELERRIDTLCASAAEASHGERELLEEIEGVLCEGYLEALREEARGRRLGWEIEELATSRGNPATVARAVHEHTLRRRALADAAAALRHRLAPLREHFVRMGGNRVGGYAESPGERSTSR